MKKPNDFTVWWFAVMTLNLAIGVQISVKPENGSILRNTWNFVGTMRHNELNKVILNYNYLVEWMNRIFFL